MKLIFLSYYSGYVDRGVETWVQEVGRRLGKNNDLIVVCAGSKEISGVKTKRLDFPIPETSAPSNSWQKRFFLDPRSKSIAHFTKQALQLSELDTSDIVIPTNGGWQVALVKQFCLKHKKKMVISGQAGIGWDERWNLLWTPNKYIALSEPQLKWARRWAPWVAVEKIPNGVDLTTFKPVENSVNKKDLQKVHALQSPVVLCVAGPEEYKRVSLTIKAVEQWTEASLVVLGGSEDTKKLGSDLLGKRYQQKIISHDEVVSAYQMADVFTLVSESCEGFGIAYVEALACGVPVVATDDDLRHEIIGEAGLYVQNPYDAIQYGHLLQQAYETDWQQAPRKRAENFSWNTIAAQYQHLFESLLDSHLC